ncbi:hypothetical protein FOZ60_017139 [Perkinsus olseni]|uniref:Uncharacterized protein n=1 Tax=Perkinsus olseni TaxID=32597 RepID=A0A7J6P3G3_PEROL|nr:hypothetical protein FOZ60_017139 [Perkinsus olseni]
MLRPLLKLFLLFCGAGAVGPEIFRTWIEADAGEASGCIVQFSPFTLHVAGRYLDSIGAVVLIRSGDTCHDASTDDTSRFLSRPGKCSPEVPGGYHNSTGVFKILCSVSARNPGTGKACFSNDSGQTYTLAPSSSLPVTIIQYDTFAVADGLVPPAKRFLGRAHVNALAARPDGIVIGGHSDGYVRFWDGASGTEVWSSRATLGGAPITGIASRGDLMAVSSAHGRASVWNITNATASEYSVLRVDNEPSSFNTIAFSSNTTDIVAVGNDLGRVFIFRLSPVLSPVVGVAQIGEPVSVLRWCADGAFMVVGTLAGSVSWWSLSDLSEPSAAIDDLCGYGGVADLQCASFGSGDSYVFAACTSGTVSVLRLDHSLSPVISNVWSLPSGRQGHEALPVAMGISPGGSEWLAVRTMDSVFIYDTNETLSSHLHPAFWDVLDGTRLLSEGSFSLGTATFYPCWPLPDANRRRLENISDLTCVSPSVAPTVALEVTLPWEFVGVRGSYTVSSIGAIPADDCTSGQLPITDWAASPGGEWSLVRAFATAVRSDCISLDGGSGIGLSGHQTCNVVNALPRPGATGLDRLVTVCDLRHCDDVTALQLQATTGGRTAYGGGYSAFGTPARVLYGGCSVPGGKIPHGHDGGAPVVIPETSFLSRPSDTLRFQVAQSNAEERVMISSIRLELLRQRPQPVRVIREPLLSSSGDSEVDANSRTGREPEGAISPWLFTTSWDLSVAAFDLRGLYLQEVPSADAFAGAVECTPSLSSIGFWPPADPAIMTTRTPGGSEYRTEFLHGDGVWRDFPVLDTSRTGITIMLCWCRAGDGCSDSADDYKTPGGILTLTRFASDPARPLRCEQHSKCVVYMAADSRPLDPGDKLMIKHLPTDPVPSGVDPCTVSPGALEGIGSSGRSDGCRAPDHSPQCLAFDFGIVDAAKVPAGNYLVCWCQGSLRPCIDDFEFSTSVSETETLVISPAQYVFPEQCAVVFLEWRAPWIGYHDCCCNFKEVGSSPGCEDPDSEASRICNDDTHYQ